MRSVARSVALVLVSTVVALGLGLATLDLVIRERWVTWDLAPFNPYSAKARGAYRVLVLGDSFSRPYPEGFGFGNLLENRLATHGIEMLNLAWSGYGPLDSLSALAREGRKFAPDLILLGYYVGNDLTDTIYRTHGLPIAQAIADARKQPRGWDGLVWRLPSLAFVADRWHRLIASGIPQPPPSAPGVEVAVQPLNPFWYLVRRDAPDFHRVNLLLAGDGPNGWQDNRQVLIQLHADAKALGARLAVLAFPSTLQVDTTHHSFFAKLGITVDPAFLDTRKPQELLEALCAEEDIPFFDLLPVFRRHAGEELYWDRDDHFNVAGMALAFHEVWRFLEGSGLLPTGSMR